MFAVKKNREEKLEALLVEILDHYDPMLGCIDLRRLDHQDWMAKTRRVIGEKKWLEVFPWAKK